MVTPSRASVRADRLRPLNLPRPVRVHLNAQTVPAAVEYDSKQRPIDAVGEVWRVDDEWWRDSISRRYTEVVLEGGKHVVLFEDLVTGEWFAQDP